MSADLQIIRASAGVVECVFEGSRAVLGFQSLDTDDLRRSAAADEARAQVILDRARRTRALADEFDRRNAEAQAAGRRRRIAARRAAATRARRRTPFALLPHDGAERER